MCLILHTDEEKDEEKDKEQRGRDRRGKLRRQRRKTDNCEREHRRIEDEKAKESGGLIYF
jgi:hypothetical protein